MLPRLCSPPQPPSWAELWGAESLQSPTLTGPPARGSSNALLLQFLYIWGKKPHLLPCGSISLTLTRRSLALVPSLFSFLCCCKFTLFVSKLGKRVELVLFWMSIHLKLFTAWIFWKPSLRTHCFRHKCFPVCLRAQHLLRTQIMFLILFRNILCPQQMFPSLRSPRNITSNNVSATMCPRLPVPLGPTTSF